MLEKEIEESIQGNRQKRLAGLSRILAAFVLQIPLRVQKNCKLENVKIKKSPFYGGFLDSIGGPSRTRTSNKFSGLFWQTGLTASVERKRLFAALANRGRRMSRPPDPEMRSPAAANGRASRNGSNQPHQLSEAASDYQAQTELAQIFGRKFVVVRKRRRSARP